MTAQLRRAEHPVFREIEREKPTSLALTIASALMFLLFVCVMWTAIYAIGGH